MRGVIDRPRALGRAAALLACLTFLAPADLVGAPAALAQARPAQGSGVTEFTAAGIPVILKPVTANEVIAVRLYLKGGSASLSPANAGIERLMGEAATRGTAKYPKETFDARRVATGTSIGSSAGNDFSVMTLQAVRRHWDEAWDLFAQAVAHPTFPAAEVELVRQRILNEIRQRTDNPDSYLNELGDSVLYTGHAYAVNPRGTAAAVQALGRDDLAKWHAARLTKENLLVVVVGNVTRADVEAKIASAFGALPRTGGAARAAQPVAAGRPELVVVERPLPTNYIMGVFPASSPADRDWAATRMAMSILSARLFEEVRTKRNLTYAVSAFVGARRANQGGLYVTAVEPETTLKVMLHEVRRLQQEPIPPKRLAEAANVFLTQYWMQQQANMDQAAALGSAELLGGAWERAYAFPAEVRAVTPQQIQEVARKYLRNARFVVIGDPKKIDRALFTSF